MRVCSFLDENFILCVVLNSSTESDSPEKILMQMPIFATVKDCARTIWERERAREGVTVEFHQYEIGHIYRDPCIANSDEATVRRKCSWRFALRFVHENRKEAHSISMHMLSCWANGTPLPVCQLFGWKSCLIMLWGQFRISSTLVPIQSLEWNVCLVPFLGRRNS